MAYSIKRGKGNPCVTTHKIRHQYVRKHIPDTLGRPYLVVIRSNHHMVTQVVNDTTGHTLCATSTLEEVTKGVEGYEAGVVHKVGKSIAERAKAPGIEAVVFNRGGNKYHGCVAATVEGAREGDLKL